MMMMMMAVMRTDSVIMMMVRFEMILNWIRIVMMIEVENINNSISNKVNRCLARYSPRATTTNQPTNRAPKKPAWPGPN